MTTNQLYNILNFYKAEVAGNHNEQALKDAHKSAVLERDLLNVTSGSTKEIDEYINELEKLI